MFEGVSTAACGRRYRELLEARCDATPDFVAAAAARAPGTGYARSAGGTRRTAAPASGSSVLGGRSRPRGGARDRAPSGKNESVRCTRRAPTEPATPALAERITVVAIRRAGFSGAGLRGRPARRHDRTSSRRPVNRRSARGRHVVLAPRACHEDSRTRYRRVHRSAASHIRSRVAGARGARRDRQTKPCTLCFRKSYRRSDVGAELRGARAAHSAACRATDGRGGVERRGSNEYIRPGRAPVHRLEAVEPPNGARREARVSKSGTITDGGIEDHGLVAIDPASVPLTEADLSSCRKRVTDFAVSRCCRNTRRSRRASRVGATGHLRARDRSARPARSSSRAVTSRLASRRGSASAGHCPLRTCDRVNTDLHSTW